MDPVAARLPTYAASRERLRSGPLRQSEIPVEHAISLLLPTLRWGEPAFAFFAAPASRHPDRPVVQGPPDRWGAFRAGGELIAYALCRAVPFAPGVTFVEETLPPIGRTLGELRESLKRIEDLMDEVAPAFFANRPIEPVGPRKHLLDSLVSHVPAPLIPQYRALAPDLFAWLEA